MNVTIELFNEFVQPVVYGTMATGTKRLYDVPFILLSERLRDAFLNAPL